jgi:outer membrane protein TolC
MSVARGAGPPAPLSRPRASAPDDRPARIHLGSSAKARAVRPVSADAEDVAPPESEITGLPDADVQDEAGDAIDLASVLRLAGIENLDLVIARQRVEAAVAVQQLAAAQSLPNLNLGTNFDWHTGLLQQSSGKILNVQRSALYAGAGANAVAAGTVPIPGLQYNLNVSESIYNYYASRQRTDAARFANQAAENEILLRVATGYTDLLGAWARRSLAILTRNDAREVARLTRNYAVAGEGRQADADRAATELARREAEVVESEARIGQASRRLTELLNLDSTLRLRPVESQLVPQSVVPNQVPLPQLLAIALVDRPELKSRQASIRAALYELDSAKMLPFSPQLIAGFSSGVFGGGSNLVASSTPPAPGLPPNQPRFGNFDGRADVDLILYWSLRNMGLGNKALIDAARARARSADFEQLTVLDRVRQEVAESYVQTHTRFAEIEMRSRSVISGVDALTEDLIRIRGREGRPIEVLDSLRRLADSRREYLDAIIGYNQAEFALYVALGKPPADTLARPVPDPERLARPSNNSPESKQQE